MEYMEIALVEIENDTRIKCLWLEFIWGIHIDDGCLRVIVYSIVVWCACLWFIFYFFWTMLCITTRMSSIKAYIQLLFSRSEIWIWKQFFFKVFVIVLHPTTKAFSDCTPIQHICDLKENIAPYKLVWFNLHKKMYTCHLLPKRELRKKWSHVHPHLAWIHIFHLDKILTWHVRSWNVCNSIPTPTIQPKGNNNSL